MEANVSLSFKQLFCETHAQACSLFAGLSPLQLVTSFGLLCWAVFVKTCRIGGLGSRQKALFRINSSMVTKNPCFVTFLEALVRAFAKRIPRFEWF